MRVAVEFTLEARVFGTDHERGAHLSGRTGVHGSDGSVVSFAEGHRSIVPVHHQEGDRSKSEPTRPAAARSVPPSGVMMPLSRSSLPRSFNTRTRCNADGEDCEWGATIPPPMLIGSHVLFGAISRGVHVSQIEPGSTPRLIDDE